MIFNNVDFQLLLTQILHLNLKRVKIASNDMEYLDKVPRVKNQSVFKEAYVCLLYTSYIQANKFIFLQPQQIW